MAAKKSGHDRKRWRVTFKLPPIKHQHTQRFIDLPTDEFTFTAYGYAAGVAVQRAWNQLREVPELKGAIIRDCFITVRCLGYYTKADEGLLADPSTEEEEVKPHNWDEYMKAEGHKEYDIPEPEEEEEPKE